MLYILFEASLEKVEVKNTKRSHEETVVERKTCLQPSEKAPVVDTVPVTNAVCLNADSQHLSPSTQEDLACIHDFALVFILVSSPL